MKRYIQAFSLALMLCSRSLTYLIDFQRSSLYIMLLGFLVILFTSVREMYDKKKFLLIAFVGVVFVISLLASDMNKTTVEYFLYFVCFGITSLLVPVIKDYKMIVRSILIIGIISIWSYINIDYTGILANVGGIRENVSAILMDISYKTLVFIQSGVMMVVTEKNKVLKIIAGTVAVIYTPIAFVYGARGTLLSMSVFLFLLWIVQAQNLRVRNIRIMKSAVLLLAVIILFSPLIIITYEFLESHGVEARSIERIYNKVSYNESMSEGREILYQKAMTGIVDSPLWGHGIGSFDNYSGVYPHNIILQLLYEGGLLLTLPLIFFLIKGILLIFSFKNQLPYRNFLLLLFCSGVIELFMSSHLWMSIFLWFFYSQSMLSENYKIKKICPKSVS